MEKWVKVVKREKWGQKVGKSTEKWWVKVVKSGEKSEKMGKSGKKW